MDGIDKRQPVMLGIDVGGSKIAAGYVNRRGEILASKRYAMNRADQASSLASIWQAIEDFRMQPWDGQQPAGIGIGVIGQVDYRTGVWVEAMNIPISTPVPLAEIVRGKHGIPAVVDNDVQAATLAELTFPGDRLFTDFIYLNVGTGIAMGLVTDGRLVRGSSNYTGEIGHMSVDPAGEPCVCGNNGCLENTASGGGMVKRTLHLLAKYPDSSLQRWGDRMHAGLVLEEADRGDPLASHIKKSALQALGTAVVNTVNLLNPEAIVLGGGVFTNAGFAQDLRAYVFARSLKPASRALKHFEISRFDAGYAGLLGAASLAWREP